jgi:hypothetical protein
VLSPGAAFLVTRTADPGQSAVLPAAFFDDAEGPVCLQNDSGDLVTHALESGYDPRDVLSIVAVAYAVGRAF